MSTGIHLNVEGAILQSGSLLGVREYRNFGQIIDVDAVACEASLGENVASVAGGNADAVLVVSQVSERLDGRISKYNRANVANVTHHNNAYVVKSTGLFVFTGAGVSSLNNVIDSECEVELLRGGECDVLRGSGGGLSGKVEDLGILIDYFSHSSAEDVENAAGVAGTDLALVAFSSGSCGAAAGCGSIGSCRSSGGGTAAASCE